MKRAGKILIPLVVLLFALYWMPFITVNINEGGAEYRVPFASSLESAGDGRVTFTSLRSAYALKKDAANAMMADGETACYGKTYYYDDANDISYYGYETESGIPSRLTYLYENGFVCDGWTDDDEIAWPYGDPADADINIDVQKAIDQEHPWFVIVDGKPQNLYLYNEFSRMFKQGVCCYFRTMIVEGNERSLIDIQLLETPVEQQTGANKQEAYYRTAVRTAEGIEENYYTRYSETAETNPRRVSVFEKDGEGVEHETVLFTYSVG